MPDIFISYARPTEEAAARVAALLREAGLSVWRDDSLPVHRPYAEVIAEVLQQASAVLVLWSADAVQSQWVRSEADHGRAAGKLVQLTLDGTQPPMPFDQIQCADLAGWDFSPGALAWQRVLLSIESLVGRRLADHDAPKGKALVEAVRLSNFPLPEKPSIAVLPFQLLSNDRSQPWLADALAEEISGALSHWRWFLVVSSRTSFSASPAPDAAAIGRRLGVRYLLSGSLQIAGPRIRIRCTLAEADSGITVWSESYDRGLDDILTVQVEIAQAVVSALEPAMLGYEADRSAAKRQTDFGALDYYYRGMWHLSRVNSADTDRALACFEQLIERDRTNALGHVGLSRALYARAVYEDPPDLRGVLERARDAAGQAIACDSQEAQGWFALSGAALYLGNHATALETANRALALNPSFAYAHYRAGQVGIFAGQPKPAIRAVELAIRCSPVDPQLPAMLETLALGHYLAGDYEAAVRTAEASPSVLANGSTILAASLARLGRLREAGLAWQKAGRQAPGRTRPRAAPYASEELREQVREGLALARAAADSVSPPTVTAAPADARDPDSGS